ncbi:MAG: hypothetical protein Kow0092_03740 [Deferrisomatales bacterium]
MSRKGFTLVELMIVVAILGILSAIAIPMYRSYITASKKSEAKANLETLRLLEEQYYADHRAYVAATGGTTDVMAKLPGFQPGNPDSLYYNYFITATTDAFTATAQPKSSSLGGNLFITDDNSRNW